MFSVKTNIKSNFQLLLTALFCRQRNFVTGSAIYSKKKTIPRFMSEAFTLKYRTNNYVQQLIQNSH